MSPCPHAHPVAALVRAGLAAVVLVLTLGLAPLQDDGSALRSYYAANGLLNRGLYDLAAEEYRAFLASYPDHEKSEVARYGLGVCLFRLEQYDAAAGQLAQLWGRADFEFAAEAMLTLGQSHLARGAHAEAADAFGEVMDRHADHDLYDDAAALRAEAQYRQGDYAGVDVSILAIQQRAPDSPLRERAELFGGLALMARGDHEAAVTVFEGMAERYPNGAFRDHTTLLLAQSLHRTSSLDAAARRYERVIDAATAQYVPDALYGLAMLQHQRGDAAAAGAQLDRMLEAYPDHALEVQARQLRGRAYFDTDDFDRAAESFDAVAQAEGDLTDDALYWRAKCDLRRDNDEQAAERMAVAMERFPDSELRPEMHYDRAVALIRLDRPDEALIVLAALRVGHSKHRLAPSALHLMAVTEHREERYDRSNELCEAYIRDFPDGASAPAIAFLAAENRFLAREYEPARALYAGFVDTYPDDPQVMRGRFRLGLCAYHLGDCDTALSELTSIVDGRNTEPLFRPALLAVGDCRFQGEQWEETISTLGDYIALGEGQTAVDDAMLKVGLAQQRLGRNEEALETFDRLIETFDDSRHRAHAVFERGQVLVALERPDEAALAFAEVIETEEGGEPRFTPHAHNHLGAIAADGGAHGTAAGHYRQVVASTPEDALRAEARLQLGQSLLAADELDAAAEAFAEIETKQPESPQAPSAAALHGIALSRSGRHEEALAQIERVEGTHAAALDADLATTVCYEKAWCLRALMRPDDAASAYRALLEREGNHALRRHAALELAELDFEAGRLDEAAKWLEGLREGDVEDELKMHATYRLGVCRYHQDRMEPAVALLAVFVEETPADDERVPSARLLAGEALFKLARHEAVIEQLTPVIANHSDDEAFGPALLRVGESLAVLQRWPESEQAFRTFLQQQAESPLWYQAQFGVGWALENEEKYEEAMSSYQQVVARHEGPTSARAQFQIGECLFAEKRYDEAARELLKVDILYAYPEWSAAAIYEAGRCFEELSNPVDARRQFEQVVAEHGETEWAPLAEARLEALSSTALPGR